MWLHMATGSDAPPQHNIKITEERTKRHTVGMPATMRIHQKRCILVTFPTIFPDLDAITGHHSDTNFYLEFASQATLHDIK